MKTCFLMENRGLSADNGGMIRHLQRLIFIAGLTGLIALAAWPYHDGALRYGLPLSLLATWSSGLWFVRKDKFPRMFLLVAPVVLAVPFVLPGKPLDADRLHTCYIAALRKLEGAPYLWGGESRRGIDCSGLPRRAMRDALLETGLATGNGTAFREWATQWWFDTSAKALGENYRGFTRPLGIVGKLSDLGTGSLEAGDLAVTSDGRHVIVFLGNGEWIQADPGPWKVAIGSPEKDDNPWFSSHVRMHRWMMLEP
ncbi:MAG: peptidoglycan endopeptidase [Verrucomicrobiaceae bacterium]|nr:MAG: peptidoglycan endopeptidase [Verrucomicrobiaceae bacterium]